MTRETQDTERHIFHGLREQVKAEYRESPLYRMRITSGTVSERVELYPKALLTGSEMRGRKLLSGCWTLGNQTHITGALSGDSGVVPWTAVPNVTFSNRLMRFEWLRDLMQCGEEGAQVARRLIRAWVAAFRGDFNALAWAPGQTAARLIAILEAGSAIVEGQPREVRGGLLEVLTWHVRHLTALMEAHDEPDERVAIATAAAVGSLAFESERHKLETCLDAVERALGDLILKASGAHGYRSPSALFDRLHDLVRLDNMLIRAGLAQRASLSVSMSKMAAALRFFMAPDKSLLPLNGGRRVSAEHVRAVMRDLGGDEPRFSGMAGYQRQVSPCLYVWADVEMAPKGHASQFVHAGCLGLEVWARQIPIFTSCGAHPDLDPDWTAALRKTAAHSVLDLIEASSSAIFSGEAGYGMAAGPDGARGVVKTQDEGGSTLEMQHSGWKHSLGLSHRRRLHITDCGRDMRGEDGLYRGVRETIAAPPEPVPFALRFHTHPDVQLDPSDEGSNRALLTLKDGSVWEFRADTPIAFAESVFIRPDGRPTATSQLVLAGRADPMGDGNSKPNLIRWRLHCLQSAI